MKKNLSNQSNKDEAKPRPHCIDLTKIGYVIDLYGECQMPTGHHSIQNSRPREKSLTTVMALIQSRADTRKMTDRLLNIETAPYRAKGLFSRR